MADITKLRDFVDCIGIAVRAGVLTPSQDDEAYVREQFGLPPMNKDVLADWKKTGGARNPITIANDAPPTSTSPSSPSAPA